jgi:hypothetical protein
MADTERRIKEAKRLIEEIEPAHLKQKESWEKEKAKQAEKARVSAPK